MWVIEVDPMNTEAFTEIWKNKFLNLPFSISHLFHLEMCIGIAIRNHYTEFGGIDLEYIINSIENIHFMKLVFIPNHSV